MTLLRKTVSVVLSFLLVFSTVQSAVAQVVSGQGSFSGSSGVPVTPAALQPMLVNEIGARLSQFQLDFSVQPGLALSNLHDAALKTAATPEDAVKVEASRRVLGYIVDKDRLAADKSVLAKQLGEEGLARLGQSAAVYHSAPKWSSIGRRLEQIDRDLEKPEGGLEAAAVKLAQFFSGAAPLASAAVDVGPTTPLPASRPEAASDPQARAAAESMHLFAADESVKTFVVTAARGASVAPFVAEAARSFHRAADAVLTVNLAEIAAAHDLAALVGAPQGYVGFGRDGLLTGQLRRDPGSVIVFEEIEKAPGEFFELLLPLAAEGVVKDGPGRAVDASRALMLIHSEDAAAAEAIESALVDYAVRRAQGRSREKAARAASVELIEKLRERIPRDGAAEARYTVKRAVSIRMGEHEGLAANERPAGPIAPHAVIEEHRALSIQARALKGLHGRITFDPLRYGNDALGRYIKLEGLDLPAAIDAIELRLREIESEYPALAPVPLLRRLREALFGPSDPGRSSGLRANEAGDPAGPRRHPSMGDIRRMLLQPIQLSEQERSFYVGEVQRLMSIDEVRDVLQRPLRNVPPGTHGLNAKEDARAEKGLAVTGGRIAIAVTLGVGAASLFFAPILAPVCIAVALFIATLTEVGGGQASPAATLLARITGWNFDWDDNIFFMPTKIILFDKTTGGEKGVTTGEFAKIRRLVGQPGEYESYEIRPDPLTGSFRNFNDAPGENNFLKDLKWAVENQPPSAWQGPSWEAFTRALSDPGSAAWTTLITARGHSAANMLEGLRYLQSKGLIQNLPPVENLYGIGGAASPSEAKVEKMKALLDKVSAAAFTAEAPAVVAREGVGSSVLHLWGFSDDDYGNFKAAVDLLAAEVKKGRWPNVKITVFYTGTNIPDKKPGAFIITPDGSIRPALPEERGESGFRPSRALGLNANEPDKPETERSLYAIYDRLVSRRKALIIAAGIVLIAGGPLVGSHAWVGVAAFAAAVACVIFALRTLGPANAVKRRLRSLERERQERELLAEDEGLTDGWFAKQETSSAAPAAQAQDPWAWTPLSGPKGKRYLNANDLGGFRFQASRGRSLGALLAIVLVLGSAFFGIEWARTPKYTAIPNVETPSLPSHFQVREKLFTFGDSFVVEEGDSEFGTVTEKVVSLTKSFTYGDAQGHVVARARDRFWSWGTQIDVTDAEGRKVGTIKENVWKSFLKVYTQYDILDAEGHKVATSEKVEVLATDITLRDASGRTVAVLKRPYWTWPTDKWQVTLVDGKAVDSRLVVMIAAYKTSVDNDRNASSSDDDKKDDSTTGDEK